MMMMVVTRFCFCSACVKGCNVTCEHSFGAGYRRRAADHVKVTAEGQFDVTKTVDSFYKALWFMSLMSSL